MKTCSKGTYGCTITSGPHLNCWVGQQIKKGDTVRNKHSGSLGKVLMIDPPGMRGFVLVEFTPGSDGLCIPPTKLELVEKAVMNKNELIKQEMVRRSKKKGRNRTPRRGEYYDDENIYNSPSIRQSIEEDRK